MYAPGGSHQLRAPGPRISRAPAGPAAAERVCVALRAVQRAQRPRLGAGRYKPPDGLGLQVDLCAGLASAAPPQDLVGQPGTVQRSELYRRLACKVMQQCADFVAGVERAPSRDEWQSVQSLRYLVHASPSARQAFLSAVQAQSVVVEDQGVSYRIPVTSVVSYLPVDQVQVVVRGLPPDCARQGALEAVLSCFGYTPAGGFPVVHERAGLVSMPAGFDGALPCLDTVVGVVATTPADPCLRRLPCEVVGEGWVASLRVETSTYDSPPVVSARPPPHRPSPTPWQPPGSAQRMTGLFAEGARGGSMWAPTAEEVLAGARPSGVRNGLGFMGPDEQGGLPVGSVAVEDAVAGPVQPEGALPLQQPAQPGHPSRVQQQQQLALPQPAPQPQHHAVRHPAPRPQQLGEGEALMAPAPPLPPPVPTHHPGFSAAVEHITECTDLSVSDAEALVLRVRDTCPAEYTAVCEVTSPGALDEGFRRALHATAVGQFGADAAAPLAVLPRGDSLDEGCEGGGGQLVVLGQPEGPETEPARPLPRQYAAVAAASPSQPPPTPVQPALQRSRKPPGQWWTASLATATSSRGGHAAARGGRGSA